MDYILFTVFNVILLPIAFQSFEVKIEPNVEECYLDYFNISDKVEFSYEVIDGGFLDVESRVLSPNDVEIMSEKKGSYGKYDFVVEERGPYHFCINNVRGSQTQKTLKIALFSEPHYRWERNASTPQGPHSDLEEMVHDLKFLMHSVRAESEYSIRREEIHDGINYSANRNFVMWAFFELLLMGSLSIGQILYLKHLFEVRRVV